MVESCLKEKFIHEHDIFKLNEINKLASFVYIDCVLIMNVDV